MRMHYSWKCWHFFHKARRGTWSKVSFKSMRASMYEQYLMVKCFAMITQFVEHKLHVYLIYVLVINNSNNTFLLISQNDIVIFAAKRFSYRLLISVMHCMVILKERFSTVFMFCTPKILQLVYLILGHISHGFKPPLQGLYFSYWWYFFSFVNLLMMNCISLGNKEYFIVIVIVILCVLLWIVVLISRMVLSVVPGKYEYFNDINCDTKNGYMIARKRFTIKRYTQLKYRFYEIQ